LKVHRADDEYVCHISVKVSVQRGRASPKSLFRWFLITLGGAGRNRTADEGFADPCLATWPPRPLIVSLGRRSAFLQHSE
jgi:hypothetical protein